MSSEAIRISKETRKTLDRIIGKVPHSERVKTLDDAIQWLFQNVNGESRKYLKDDGKE